LGANTKKLISVSSGPLCDHAPALKGKLVTMAGALGNDLLQLLTERNGFYCFESALHVFPSGCAASVMSIERWNSTDLWRKDYASAVEGYLFFAEDVFGDQFGLNGVKVYRFDPENGEIQESATSLEKWAGKLLEDTDYETGYSLANAWQQQNGPLAPGMRLVPKVPFILGGEYKADNLYALDAIEAMKYRADIWNQIKNLPDGTPVRIKVLN